MNWQYIASLFDHKGNINFVNVKGKQYMQLRIYGSDPNVLNMIHEFIGRGNIYMKQLSSKNPNWSNRFELTITNSKHIFEVFTQMMPFLLSKKDKVDELLANYPLFQELRAAEKSKKDSHLRYIG